MRVIAGEKKGMSLYSLEGLSTRPTSDRVKEAVFSIIQFNIEDCVFLDLFSGSGQMAIEAISRGAKKAFACDMSRDAVDIIKRNLKKTGYGDKVEIMNSDYSAAINRIGEKVDIIFIDPPYDSDLCLNALKAINEKHLLSENGIIVCETQLDKDIQSVGNYVIKKQYVYGKTKIITYINGEKDENSSMSGQL